MKVLITAATKHGATGEIAQVIGDALRQRGWTRRCSSPSRSTASTATTRWCWAAPSTPAIGWKPAQELVARCGDALAARPVWLFSSGPVGDPPKPEEDPVDVAEVLAATRAREHRVFAGKLVRKQLAFPERAIVSALRVPEGDFPRLGRDHRVGGRHRHRAGRPLAGLRPAAMRPPSPPGGVPDRRRVPGGDAAPLRPRGPPPPGDQAPVRPQASAQGHGVADRGALKDQGAVVAGDGGAELGDRLVLAGLEDLDLAGDLVAGADGARKSQLTLRNTVPGPGRRSATTALRMALVTPPWTTISPKRDARAARARRSAGGGGRR